MTSEPVIDVRGVWKAYADPDGEEATLILRDMNLSVCENEFLCIVGPSGCGKTTLLNLIAGFERPQRGTISYRGSPIKGPSSERSVIFQEYSLLPWMNVQKNVAFSIDRKTHSDKERMDIAMEYLGRVGLEDYYDKRPGDLSGGMKQRVAIARTLAMRPDVMLMDEPFSALDEQTRSYLDGEIKDIWHKEKKTVVFVTHSIDEALLLGTRIVMLSNDAGKITGEWTVPDDGLLKDKERYGRLRNEISNRLQRCKCADNRPNIIKIE